MTWVKICGLTREADVASAIDAGADALGFVLAEGSARRISPEWARDLMNGVPAVRILVTVDASPGEVAAMVEATGADGIQPHGKHAAAAARAATRAGLLVLRPVRTREGETAAEVPEGQIPIFDSALGTEHGGTGRTLDWMGLTVPDRPFVLAGGLTPANVAEAVSIVRPWGVDASSGLESEPGIKDPARVAAFIAAAKGL
ncbi:MAG: phosphoribosylanthranilate isomerase [Actinomycetota bacterium]